jgi:hypothetical protein|nr:MAG TPA: ParB protein [Caudoviricetes sp.]
MENENISRYQSFETETISRDKLKGAPYNPRILDKENEKRLRKGIRKFGLVQPIVWNKRTGNVVSGHQRLKQLDALEKRGDYDLTVCVIDVDDRDEATLNVQLNNVSMMGDWDMDKLADMTAEFDLSFDDMGFSQLDVDFMFDGDDRFSELFDTPEAEQVKGRLDEIKAARESGREALKDANNINFYTVVVFKDEYERNEFMRDISIPAYEQYVTCDQVRRLSNKA